MNRTQLTGKIGGEVFGEEFAGVIVHYGILFGLGSTGDEILTYSLSFK